MFQLRDCFVIVFENVIGVTILKISTGNYIPRQKQLYVISVLYVCCIYVWHINYISWVCLNDWLNVVCGLINLMNH